MSAADRIRFTLSRRNINKLLPPLAYNPEDQLFYLDGGYMGACFLSPPLTGADDTTVTRLQSAIAEAYPKGTVIQIQLLSSRDVEKTIDLYNRAKQRHGRDGFTPDQKTTLDTLVRRRCDLFSRAKDKPFIKALGVPINTLTVIVSIKVPCEARPSEDTETAIADIVEKFEAAMSSAGLGLMRLDNAGYLTLMRRLLKPHSTRETWCDEDRLLRDQIFAPEDAVEVTARGLTIGESVVKILSVKNYPKRTSLALMGHIGGDPLGKTNQISMPYLITLTLHFPNQREKAGQVRTKAQTLNFQFHGPLAKYIPRLQFKKAGMDVLVHAMEDAETLMEVSLNVILFAPDHKKANQQVAMLKTYYSAFDLAMDEERYISWPMFWNSMPLFPGSESIRLTSRFQTMASRHATQFMPILGEWIGTGRGAAMLLTTRRNQPMLVDLYDAPASNSALVFAESRGGKTFFAQQMIVDYLAMGAKVWVIDSGRSYYKLSKILDGEFMVFSEDSRINMNPFTHLQSIDDDADLLKNMLSKMAAPRQGFDDFQMSVIEEAMKAVYGRLGGNMAISDVADYLSKQDDQRAQDMARMLFPFTRNGAHGAWFDGENNINFDNQLVVLELEELKSKKHLQQIVLMQLVARIQQEMFLTNDNRPKVVIIDEGWDLIDDEGMSRFLEHGFRRSARAQGSFVLITQSLFDQYRTEAGRAMAANAPTKIILSQKGETIEALEKKKILDIDAFGLHQLKTLHKMPGAYAELMVHTSTGWGVGRLATDRFTQVLFGSEGPEKTVVTAALEAGVDPVSAVDDYIAQYG